MMHKIATIPGDGIGPEVIAQGMRVLETVSRICGFAYEARQFPYGAEHYLAHGETMPADALDEFRKYSAIYLGALGDPRVGLGILERGIVGAIRWGLDLYVNLRPITLYSAELTPLKNKGPQDVDFVVVRENTEDCYTGVGGLFKKGTPDEVAIQEIIYTRKGVERIIRYAFELTRSRNKRKKLTLVDKANAVGAHDLWRRVFTAVGEEYPDIERENMFVDACCMWMLKNPESFDVVVTTNMFGDIITDLGAMIQGGMGVAGSANMHPGQVSMFEPIHGSSPKHAGKNEANPIGAILTLSMMLAFLGEHEASRMVEGAVAQLLASGQIKDVSAQSGVGTTQVGDLVIAELERQAGMTTATRSGKAS
jgi:3-isopropylmalate dehydrogenase